MCNPWIYWLDFPPSKNFTRDVVINSIPGSYGMFISNGHMHDMDNKLNKLHGILKTTEAGIKQSGTNQVIVTSPGRVPILVIFSASP
jgi:hypothetical protein